MCNFIAGMKLRHFLAFSDFQAFDFPISFVLNAKSTSGKIGILLLFAQTVRHQAIFTLIVLW